MRFAATFLSVLLVAAALPQLAHAQAQSTDIIAMPQAISVEDVEMASVDFDEAFGMIDNEFLSDVVKLNYQISLLEKMVERQAELQKIKESFQIMGADFDVPAPPRGICAQLPANAACLKEYPDLYAEIVANRKAYYERMRAEAAARDPKNQAYAGESKEEAAARRAREEAALREKLAKAERKTRYKWTDITCTGGECRGVLVATARQGYRATVHRGSTLGDGTIVESVSKNGIVVSIAGDTIHVRPAPRDGSSSEDGASDSILKAIGSAGDSDISAAAAAIIGNAEAGTAATANTDSDDGTTTEGAAGNSSGSTSAAAGAAGESGDIANTTNATGQTVAEPSIGPSGLF